MPSKNKIAELTKWYDKPLGKALLRSEIKGLSNLLPEMFGYYLVQLGGPTNNPEVLSSSPINNQIIVNSTFPSNQLLPAIKSDFNQLPFIPSSIDVIVAFHLLELTENPKKILDEIYSSLMPGGYVIIFSFNPYSLWGIYNLNKNSQKIPKLNHWIKPGKMRSLLTKANFTVADYKTFYFRPPSKKTKKFLFLEGIGQIFWPYCGAAYMFVAQKTVAEALPIQLLHPTKQLKIAKGLPKLISRSIQ